MLLFIAMIVLSATRTLINNKNMEFWILLHSQRKLFLDSSDRKKSH